MSTPSELPKGFFPVQTRVSKGRNPDLYEHLQREAQNGESPGAVLRRLAEEALMLRNHPLTRALQAIDFKTDSRQTVHTTPAAGLEQKADKFHTATPQVSTTVEPKASQKVQKPAQTNGAQQMAAVLVARTTASAVPRG